MTLVSRNAVRVRVNAAGTPLELQKHVATLYATRTFLGIIGTEDHPRISRLSIHGIEVDNGTAVRFPMLHVLPSFEDVSEKRGILEPLPA